MTEWSISASLACRPTSGWSPVGRCHVIGNASPDVKLFMEENPDSGSGGTSTAKVTAGFAPTYVPGG